jgi:hypothetical protein
MLPSLGVAHAYIQAFEHVPPRVRTSTRRPPLARVRALVTRHHH